MSAYNLACFDVVSVRPALLCVQSGTLTAAARDGNLVSLQMSPKDRSMDVP